MTITKASVEAGQAMRSRAVAGEAVPDNAVVDDTGQNVFGGVEADPAANTVLGRLKAIATLLSTLDGRVDGLEPLITTLNGFVDGVEGLIGTTNTSLTGLAAYVDGLEGLATSLNGFVDGIEALQGTTNTTLASISGFVDGLETLITTLNTYVDGLESALAGVLTEATFTTRIPTLGPKAGSGSVSVVPSTDQDPIFDHANGVKLAVTTNVTLITTAAGHKFLRINSDADVLIRTDGGGAAADDASSILIYGKQPEVIPVPPGTIIKAMAVTGTANVRATPLKVR